MRSILFSGLLLGLVACSANTVNVTGGAGPAMADKDTAQNARSYATKTPPAGARSMGMMSNPQVGSTTIPITNVEVYVFTANIDEDTSGETLYWAIDDDYVYVWGDIDIECVDEDDQPTGETGTADFVLEADDYGWGWMVATDSCGYSTIYGCSADGDEAEVCGGCDWDESFIVCVAE